VKYWLGVKIAEDWIVPLFHYMSGHLFFCLDHTSFLALLLPLASNVLKFGAVFGTMQKLWKISLLFDVSQASEQQDHIYKRVIFKVTMSSGL
jgi:hypothetical protein